jgi:2'-5' RNA ligase
MQEELIRSFIAIELPPEMVSRLKEFQARFKLPRHTFVKWVSPESIHLTLKFLGNVTMKQVEQLNAMLQTNSREFDQFELRTARTGCFPNEKRVRVFWLGLEGEIPKLMSLHKAIDEGSAKLGFPSENRPYTAHLTLARIKEECSPSQRWEFVELIRDASFEPESIIQVKRVSLMRSKLTPGGAVYTRLAEHHLS